MNGTKAGTTGKRHTFHMIPPIKTVRPEILSLSSMAIQRPTAAFRFSIMLLLLTRITGNLCFMRNIRANIRAMDQQGYSFAIMARGMSDLVNSLVLENKGTFENKWAKHIEEYDVYGTTVKRKSGTGYTEQNL